MFNAYQLHTCIYTCIMMEPLKSEIWAFKTCQPLKWGYLTNQSNGYTYRHIGICCSLPASQFIQLNNASEEKSLASGLLKQLETATHILISSLSLDRYVLYTYTQFEYTYILCVHVHVYVDPLADSLQIYKELRVQEPCLYDQACIYLCTCYTLICTSLIHLYACTSGAVLSLRSIGPWYRHSVAVISSLPPLPSSPCVPNRTSGYHCSAMLSSMPSLHWRCKITSCMLLAFRTALLSHTMYMYNVYIHVYIDMWWYTV